MPGERLQLHEREEISRGLVDGESFRQIARRLDRSTSTVSREVGRNGGRDRYRACGAQQAAAWRARRPGLVSWPATGGCATRSKPGWTRSIRLSR